MTIITLIIVFILAVLLVVKYDKLDYYFFSAVCKDDSYEVFGKRSIFVSGACGAVMTVGVVMKKVFELDWNVEAAVLAGLLLLVIVVSFNVYRSFENMPTMGSAIGKAFFLLFTSIVGAIVGMVGSLIVIGLLVLYLLLMVFGAMLSGSGSSSSSSSSSSSYSSNEEDYDAKTTDEHGYERKLKETIGGNYIDDKGDRWKSTGFNQVTRDDD